METSLVIIDAMGPQEWMTAGKVVIGGEGKAGGRKRGEGDRKRSFLLSNGRLLLWGKLGYSSISETDTLVYQAQGQQAEL